MSDLLKIFSVTPRLIRVVDMVCVIAKEKQPILTREISRRSGLSDAEIHDYATKLREIVMSVRGKQGGYILCDPDVTIGDIISCLGDTHHCRDDIHLSRLRTAINRVSRIKINDLIEEE